MTCQLTEYEGLPEGLLDLPAARLHERLSGPSLIHLPGRDPRPLFVSVLLHGNEDTGWEAVRRFLSDHAAQQLPRALSLFIGNVTAARYGVRHLDEQADYNRIWNGGDRPEQRMAQQVLAAMERREVFAALDIHNNTGLNPHYACVNRLDHRFLQLATLFSRTVVYFIRPAEVQSLAFSRLCPAVTVECGKPGQRHSEEHARDFVGAALRLKSVPEHPVAAHDYDLFHTVAQVTVPADVVFSFDDPGADLVLYSDLDRLNFRELPAGTRLASVNGGHGRLNAVNEAGEDVAETYFDHGDGVVVTRVPVMPSMLTLDAAVIRQDCLCYLMERLPPLA